MNRFPLWYCNIEHGNEYSAVAMALLTGVRSSGPHPLLGESSTFRRGVRVRSSEAG